MNDAYRAVLSPCIGVCTLDLHGRCDGCLRTLNEIAQWTLMSEDQRLHVMERELPYREQQRDLIAQLPERNRLVQVLHSLSATFNNGDGWNRGEFEDLLPAETNMAPAAVLIGLVPRVQGTQVLLTRRTAELRHHAGQVSFPGGRIEKTDAGIVAAALRETQEEIAIEHTQIAPLGFTDPYLTISGFRVVPVVAVIDPHYIAQPDPGEVAEVFEVPLDFLMAAENLRHVQLEFRGRLRNVLEYDWPNQRIWGVTASILFNLRERLNGVV